MKKVHHVKVHEAKTNFSKLLKAVEDGDEVIVHRGDVPVARLVRYEALSAKRGFGALKGKIWMSDDFDDPLPEFEEYM
jgi:prevent-host-death family protein